jgi:hypothetical protein
MQDCTYYKYYLKIIFLFKKNKVHPYKRLKKYWLIKKPPKKLNA